MKNEEHQTENQMKIAEEWQFIVLKSARLVMATFVI